MFCSILSTVLVVVLSVLIGFALSDGRYLLDFLNRFVFPQGPLLVQDAEHLAWRQTTRAHAARLAEELLEWEAKGNGFPEFTSLTPQHYFPEADQETYGLAQERAWGFLWLRLYGLDTKLVEEFPRLVELYDSLPVEIISIGISKLDPGRGDVTHFGEFRGTWRQLLTIESPSPINSVRLGLYPYGSTALCDSIWTPPDVFQTGCQPTMEAPWVHTYETGKDILFDDSVWHFIDNDSTEGRRVAIWIDVVRTDIGLVQKLVLRAFLFAAKYLNPEATEIVDIVNGINYQEQKPSGSSEQETQKLLDDAPQGPLESYDKLKTVDNDAGFR